MREGLDEIQLIILLDFVFEPFHSLILVMLLQIYMQHGASQEEFLRAEVTQAVKDVTFDLASLANAHLLKVLS